MAVSEEEVVAEKERLMGLETSEMVWVLVKTDMRQVVTEDIETKEQRAWSSLPSFSFQH